MFGSAGKGSRMESSLASGILDPNVRPHPTKEVPAGYSSPTPSSDGRTGAGSATQTDGATGPAGVDLVCWMERYQQADASAPDVLITAVSPSLLRFFGSQRDSREYAEDLLQETWLRIHRVRHTYRPGAPVLPWMYAIARRVRVDHYRRNRRISWHELQEGAVPERAVAGTESLPDFDTLMAALPAAQREVVTMLKATGMSVEDVARATSSTVGAVKQKAHRAYQKLRDLLIGESANTNDLESDRWTVVASNKRSESKAG